MNIEKLFLRFIKLYLPDRPRLLLGLSGGSDSMSLFYLLQYYSYPFEAVYIDHGWRSESAQEAEELRQLCQKFSVVYHLRKIVPRSITNMEDAARKARLACFKDLLEQRMLHGVLLGHHADDHAETVLKRIFEGATLPKIRGLLPKSEMLGLSLYRPLLKARKEWLVSWLEQKGYSYFIDYTNHDPKFLRTRLRHSVIPQLSHHFGKEICSNLCRLGEMAAELDDYLAYASTFYLKKIVSQEGGGIYLDFGSEKPPVLLIKNILRSFFAQKSIALPYQMIEQIALHISANSASKTWKIKNHTITVHLGKISFWR